MKTEKDTWNLSEQIINGYSLRTRKLWVSDVSEFIRRLKEEIENKNAKYGGYSIGELGREIVLEIINRLAGKSLAGEKE
jgi:hypothetical protein